MAVSGEGGVADPRGELTIDFGVTGNGADYRRKGWANPELRHTWTIGQTSTLELPRPAVAGDYRLELEIGPFIWQDRLPAQRLVIAINGRELCRFVITKVETLDCAVPWDLIAQNSRILVTFSHPDAARPIDVNRCRITARSPWHSKPCVWFGPSRMP
jgi:hypothetical protein